MSARSPSPAQTSRAALVLVWLAVAACREPTAPGGSTPAGTRLLATPEFSDWRWLPGRDEIIFSTPSYPYSAPNAAPTRFDAVSVPGGARRTIVAAPSDGSRIIGYRFDAVGAHVYFQLSHQQAEATSLLRAPIAGVSTLQILMDTAPLKVVASPDERMLAWVQQASSGLEWTLVTMDVASGARRSYRLQQPGDRVTWSPTGRSVVVDPEDAWFAAGTPFQWIDLQSGVVRVWLAPASEHTPACSRDIGWEGEMPFLYSAGALSIARYSLATGERETLSTLPPESVGVGWSQDFETIVTATNECLQWSTGPFGGDCMRWRNSVDRLAWRSGERTNVLRHEGPSSILGRLSPDGKWLAYGYGSCGGGCESPGDGLYVVRVR